MKKGYAKVRHITRDERAYSPLTHDLFLILKAMKEQGESVEVVRTKAIKDHKFPMIVIAGPRSALINMEATYDRLIERAYPDLGYDELQKKKAPHIRQEQERVVEKFLSEQRNET